jgi:hypothetical protein
VARAVRLARAQRAPPPPPPLPLRADTGVAASASGPVSLQLRARTHLWCPIRIIVSYIIYLYIQFLVLILCVCAGASLKCVCLLSCAYLFGYKFACNWETVLHRRFSRCYIGEFSCFRLSQIVSHTTIVLNFTSNACFFLPIFKSINLFLKVFSVDV